MFWKKKTPAAGVMTQFGNFVWDGFSLISGFRKWPDGALTVHFRGREVIDSHIDD